MWHIPEIIDMQYGSMHNDCPGANLDPAGCGMQVTTLIQIYPIAQPNMIGIPQADIILDRGGTLHVQNQAVQDTAQTNPYYCRDPTKGNQKELLKEISRQRR
jgi:hypothetical protein